MEELVTAENNSNAKPPKKKKSRVHGLVSFLCVIAIIAAVVTLMYYLLPIFGGVVGIILGFFIAIIIIFSTVFTLGTIYANDGYRNWVGNDAFTVPSFFLSIGEHIQALSPYFPIAAWIAIGTCSLTLLLGIIGTAVKARGYVRFIVLGAIFLTLAVLATILFYANGGKVIS